MIVCISLYLLSTCMKQLQTGRMIRLFYLIIISYFSISTVHAAYTDRSFTNKLQLLSDEKDNTAKALFSITKNVQQFLNIKFTKISSHVPYVTLKIEGTPPSTDSYKTIYFKRSELRTLSSNEILYRIMKQLLRRSLVSLYADPKAEVPEWLTASLIYIHTVGETLSSQEKYPITRQSIINQKFPDFDELITAPAPKPSHYWLYKIYAERCAVFYRGIVSLKSGKKQMMSYLARQKEKNILENFSEQYDEFKTQKLRNKWYKKASQKVCFNVINPYPPEEIRKKVNSLLSVTVARPGNNGFGTMRMPLEDVPNDSHKAIDSNYLTLMEGDLLEIYMTSSETIRPAIQKYIICVSNLRLKKSDEFKKDLKEAKKSFNDAINRQSMLNLYLDQLEKDHNEILTDYRRIILSAELAEKRDQIFFEDFKEYLDELEKKLAAISIE